jgi:hypothetical protein
LRGDCKQFVIESSQTKKKHLITGQSKSSRQNISQTSDIETKILMKTFSLGDS